MSAFGKTSAFAPGWGQAESPVPQAEKPPEPERHLATYDKRRYAAVPTGDLEDAIASLRELASYAQSPEANIDALRTWPESVADDLERHLRG